MRIMCGNSYVGCGEFLDVIPMAKIRTRGFACH
jgi:hypothetical protein